MLLKGKAEYDETPKERFMLDFIDCQTFDQLPSPRFINTHLLFETLPSKDILEKKPKIIFVYRNPKDLAVSAYGHLSGSKNYNGTFNNFLPLFMKDACMLIDLLYIF